MNNNYSFQVNQISPFAFNIVAETPDHLKFSTNLQCQPNLLTVENLIKNLTDRATRNNWILELNDVQVTRITKDKIPENKDKEVIDIQKIKEIKLIPVELEKAVDNITKIEDNTKA